MQALQQGRQASPMTAMQSVAAPANTGFEKRRGYL